MGMFKNKGAIKEFGIGRTGYRMQIGQSALAGRRQGRLSNVERSDNSERSFF